MLVIDGQSYDVPVLSVKRTADFLDKYASRTEDGVMQREIIGTFFNYKLELGRARSPAEYQRLWNKLTDPTEFHEVTVPDEKGWYTFTAYFSNVSDQLKVIENGTPIWRGLTVNFTARSPART